MAPQNWFENVGENYFTLSTHIYPRNIITRINYTLYIILVQLFIQEGTRTDLWVYKKKNEIPTFYSSQHYRIFHQSNHIRKSQFYTLFPYLHVIRFGMLIII